MVKAKIQLGNQNRMSIQNSVQTKENKGSYHIIT